MLYHKGTQTLRTKRLVLRRFTTADAHDMYKNWASDERVTQFLTWTPHKNLKETKSILSEWKTGYKEENTYNWAMEYEGHVIGGVSIVRCSDKREYAELGYCIGYDYWSQGFMTEAVQAIVSFLFIEVGFHRLEVAHAVRNPASGRVAQKCGFTYEGTKRESFKNADGEFLDVAFYGLLKNEWKPYT